MTHQSAKFDFQSCINPESTLPIYKQLQRGIRMAIQDRALIPGETLPAERDLTNMLGISRMTVRRALDELVEFEFLERRQGAGTYVANRFQKGFAEFKSFSEDMSEHGFDARSTWISIKEDIIDATEAKDLEIPVKSRVYRIRRVRYANETPQAIQDSIVPAHCIEDIDNIGESLYSELAKTGSKPYHGQQRLRASLFTSEQAELLETDKKTPCLFIERRSYSVNNRLVELTKSYYRGDAYEMVSKIRS